MVAAKTAKHCHACGSRPSGVGKNQRAEPIPMHARRYDDRTSGNCSFSLSLGKGCHLGKGLVSGRECFCSSVSSFLLENDIFRDLSVAGLISLGQEAF